MPHVYHVCGVFKVSPGNGRGHGELALAFRRSNDPQAHDHARREIPTAKNLSPISSPCHQSDEWKFNLRGLFRASRESEIVTTRKNFLDPSHMKL